MWSPVTTTWSGRTPGLDVRRAPPAALAGGDAEEASSGSAKRWRSVSCRISSASPLGVRASGDRPYGIVAAYRLDRRAHHRLSATAANDSTTGKGVCNASVPLEVAPSAFAGLLGVARRDTTPPEGIYARMWGAATRDFAEGRAPAALDDGARAPGAPAGRGRGCSSPSTSRCSAISAAPRTPSACSRRSARRSGSSAVELLVNCSHTHSAPWAAMSRSDNAGRRADRPLPRPARRGDPRAAGEEALDGSHRRR